MVETTAHQVAAKQPVLHLELTSLQKEQYMSFIAFILGLFVQAQPAQAATGIAPSPTPVTDVQQRKH